MRMKLSWNFSFNILPVIRIFPQNYPHVLRKYLVTNYNNTIMCGSKGNPWTNEALYVQLKSKRVAYNLNQS